MLHYHVSTKGKNRQTQHWLERGPFAFLAANIGEGETRGVELVGKVNNQLSLSRIAGSPLL